jgi:hypothetical protein
MCPACIGSAFLLLTGASSAGGLALIASRAFGAGLPARRAEDAENLNGSADQELRADGTSARESDSTAGPAQGGGTPLRS